MAGANDNRDGLSPPPRTIFDVFGEDEEDDDIYQPATEDSTDADGMDEDEDEDEDEFLGSSYLRGLRFTS